MAFLESQSTLLIWIRLAFAICLCAGGSIGAGDVCEKWVLMGSTSMQEVQRCKDLGGYALALLQYSVAWCIWPPCKPSEWQASPHFISSLHVAAPAVWESLKRNGSNMDKDSKMLEELCPPSVVSLDFAIVGFPKAATTSVFGSLRMHPQVLFPSPPSEDPTFFRTLTTKRYQDLEDGFRRAAREMGIAQTRRMRGLYSPMMILNGPAMASLATVQGVKIIVLVRDPIDLFQSWIDFGVWPEWFCQALKLDPLFQSLNIRKNAWDFARSKRLLVVPFDAIKYSPLLAFRRIAEFLGIAPWPKGFRFEVRNRTPHGPWRVIDVCGYYGGLNLHKALRELFSWEYDELRKILHQYFLASNSTKSPFALDDEDSQTSHLLITPLHCPSQRSTKYSQDALKDHRPGHRPGQQLRNAVCDRGEKNGCFHDLFTCERCCFSKRDCWNDDPIKSEQCCRQWRLGDFARCVTDRHCLLRYSDPVMVNECINELREIACGGPHDSPPHCCGKERPSMWWVLLEAASVILREAFCSGLSLGGCCLPSAVSLDRGVCVPPVLDRHGELPHGNSEQTCCHGGEFQKEAPLHLLMVRN